MKKITERSLIRDVHNAFRKQYRNKQKVFRNGKDVEITTILKGLAALDLEKASPEDVEKIIGNQSWTNLKCDECQCYVKAVVQVGGELDYESYTARLCLDCARKAYVLAREQQLPSIDPDSAIRAMDSSGEVIFDISIDEMRTLSKLAKFIQTPDNKGSEPEKRTTEEHKP